MQAKLSENQYSELPSYYYYMRPIELYDLHYKGYTDQWYLSRSV